MYFLASPSQRTDTSGRTKVDSRCDPQSISFVKENPVHADFALGEAGRLLYSEAIIDQHPLTVEQIERLLLLLETI